MFILLSRGRNPLLNNLDFLEVFISKITDFSCSVIFLYLKVKPMFWEKILNALSWIQDLVLLL